MGCVERRGADDQRDLREALGERGEVVGAGAAGVDGGGPEAGAQRVDGGERLGRVVRAGERRDAPGERGEVAGRTQAVELGVGAERTREGGADGGSLGRELGRGDRGDGIERGALEQRQQPALRDRLRATGEQLGLGPLHGHGPARAWGGA